LISEIVAILGYHDTEIYSILILAIVILPFLIGWKINSTYYNRVINRIYKAYHEKCIINNLNKPEWNDESRVDEGKKESKDIINSLDRIVGENFIKKDIKVFKNHYECDMACRFLRHNRNIEAFYLMKELFKEGMQEFKQNSDIYIVAWYYIHSMKIFYKNNDLLDNYDIEIFNGDEILDRASKLKNNIRERYLITYADELVEKERREISLKQTETNIEETIKIEKLRIEAVNYHFKCLKEIKDLFMELKKSNYNKEVISYLNNIENVYKAKTSGNNQYLRILREYPDDKDTMKLYMLFLYDISNRDDLANKYVNLLGEQPSRTLRRFSKDSSNKTKNNIRKVNLSSNSLNSNAHSEDYSAASGLGREVKKKLTRQNTMSKKYTDKIRSLKTKTIILMGLMICILIVLTLVIIFIFNYITSILDIYNTTTITPFVVANTSYRVRMFGNSIMADIPEKYEYYRNLLMSKKEMIDGTISNIMGKFFRSYMSTYPLFNPVGNYGYDLLRSESIADSFMRFIANYKYTFNRNMLQDNETIFDILYEPHFKYFALNIKENFALVYDESSNIIQNLMRSKFSILYVVLIISEALFVIITVLVTYNSFGPLRKITEDVTINIFGMFKYISKHDIQKMIDDYNSKIEDLNEIIGMDEDYTEIKRRNNKNSRWNIIIGISCVALLGYSILVVFQQIITLNNTNSTADILEESSKRLYYVQNIQYFTHEVIHQDRTLFLEGEPERLLNNNIYMLKKLQESLKDGSYGGPTFDNYPELDFILKDTGCYRVEGTPCENLNYNETSLFGFSEVVSILPLNELISEYLYYVHNFIDNVKEENYIQLPFTNKQNIQLVVSNELNDNFFKLQNELMDSIISKTLIADDYLIDHIRVEIQKGKSNSIILLIIGSLLIIFVNFFVFNKVYSLRAEELDTLVIFAFYIPPAIFNKNERYKKFLETGITTE
jgi:hypothetical protein